MYPCLFELNQAGRVSHDKGLSLQQLPSNPCGSQKLISSKSEFSFCSVAQTVNTSYFIWLGLRVVHKDELLLHVFIFSAPNAKVTLVIRLGHADTEEGDFEELISANETRKLECTFPYDVSTVYLRLPITFDLQPLTPSPN